MCLGVPGQIVEVFDDAGARMAWADFIGVRRRVCLTRLPDLQPGDWVLTHAGYALSHLTELDARETIAMMRDYGLIDEESARQAGVG